MFGLLCLMWKGHCEGRVSFFAVVFVCEHFHSLRTYQTNESNIEENCMLDESKSNVQDTKSSRNRVFTTELNKHVQLHESSKSSVQIKT